MKDTLLRILCACCAACLLAVMATAAQAAAPPPLEIRADNARVPLWPILRIVAVPERQLTPGEAAELTSGSLAQAVDSPERVLGRGATPWWAGFSITNAEA